MKRRIRNIYTCLCLFPEGAFLLSSRLDSAVKRSSSEVLKLSFQRKGSCSKRLYSEVLIQSEEWVCEWHAADARIEPKCQKIVQRWLEGNGKPVKRRIVLEAIQEVHPILVDLKTCIM